MWGGPTPHNLVTLSLYCAVRTCSEVPITSSDRDTTEAREGRPHSPSLGHPCPGAGSSFTQREVPYDWVSAPRPTPPDASWDHAGDTTHFGRNELMKKDYGRTAQSALLDNTKASIDPIFKSDYKSGDQIGIGAQLKHLQDEVTNYLPPTVNKKCGAAVPTDDTFGDLTLGGYCDARHVHFASTPVRPEVSNINLTTPPCATKEETIAESVLHNMMQTLASEFKHTREPKIHKFRGGTLSGTLLGFKSWMQDIECTIKDHNLNNDKALQLIKEFSEGCAHNNINFYLEVTDKPSIDGLFENLRQVFSSGEDGQQMLAEFYSCTQNPKESVKEFGESLLQITRKITMAKPEFKVDIDNTLKAHFADSLRDHYHQAMAREMICSCPTLSYITYKWEVLKTLGSNVKPCSITVSKLETSDIE